MRGHQKVHCGAHYQDQFRCRTVGKREDVPQQIKYDFGAGR